MNSDLAHEIVLRPARYEDSTQLRRLAALDSAPPPAPADGRVLLAIVDGEPWAALSVSDGAVVADPFRPTTAVVSLLAQRAASLRACGAHELRARRRLPLPTRPRARALRPSRP